MFIFLFVQRTHLLSELLMSTPVCSVFVLVIAFSGSLLYSGLAGKGLISNKKFNPFRMPVILNCVKKTFSDNFHIKSNSSQ